MDNPGPAHRYCPACRTAVQDAALTVRALHAKASDPGVFSVECPACHVVTLLSDWKQYWEMREEAV